MQSLKSYLLNVVFIAYKICQVCETPHDASSVALPLWQNNLRAKNENDTIKMHALDWLNERGCILGGAFQPIEGVHFYRYRFRYRYRGLCDLALKKHVALDRSSWSLKSVCNQIFLVLCELNTVGHLWESKVLLP